MAIGYREQQQRKRTVKRQLRIGNILGFVMLAIAITFDAIQVAVQVFHVVPIAGTALALILPMFIGIWASWIIFPLWFRFQQVQLLSGWLTVLRVAGFLVAAIGEFVTFVNSLPLISISVLINLILVRLEDVFKSKEKLEAALREAKNPRERRTLQAKMRKHFIQGRPYDYQQPQEAVAPESPRKGKPKSVRAMDIGRTPDSTLPANYNVSRPFDRSRKKAA